MNEIELKKRAQRIADRLNALGFVKDGKAMVIDQAYELVAAGEGLRNQHVLRKLAKRATGADLAVATFAQGVYAAGYRPAGHIPPLVIPRLPDDKFIEAILVEHGPHDDTDVDFAFEAWELLVEEASRRAGIESISAESEGKAYENWTQTVSEQGWDSDSQIIHLEGFIRNCGLMGEFATYIRSRAEEEVAFDTEDGLVIPPHEPLAVLNPEVARSQAVRLGYEVKTSDLKRPFWECGDVASEDFETEQEAWTNAYTTAVSVALAGAGVEAEASLSPQVKRSLMFEYGQLRMQGIKNMLSISGFQFRELPQNRVMWTLADHILGQGVGQSVHHAVGQAWRFACKKSGIPQSVLGVTDFATQIMLVHDALRRRPGLNVPRVGNKVSYPEYVRSLKEMNRHDLVDEVATFDPSLKVADWADVFIVAHLQQTYRNEFHRVALEAYESFDFGPEEVEDSSGAEYSVELGIWRKPVFLRPSLHRSQPGTIDTRKVVFCVKVENLKVISIEIEG